MKTYNTQEEFLKDCDLINNIFEIEEGLELNFNLYYPNLKIKCKDLFAYDICSNDIKANDLIADDIISNNITANNITANDITANNIYTYNIKARNIKAKNINSGDLYANNIIANNICYFAICYAYNNIICNSIKGRRNNAKHFCLDGNLTINGVIKNA